MYRFESLNMDYFYYNFNLHVGAYDGAYIHCIVGVFVYPWCLTALGMSVLLTSCYYGVRLFFSNYCREVNRDGLNTGLDIFG
jgi:hypothetical protein